MAKTKETKKDSKEKKGGAHAAPAAAADRIPAVPARVAGRYKADVIPAMMKRFGYTNVNQVPRLSKISINIGG